jgi:high-affinity iron transporter
MLAGLAVGAVTLAGIAWVLLRTSRRLPIGTFFAASSWLIAILAFVLAGKGVKALQEAGWVSLSPAPLPRMEWIGVFPTWQSLSAQVAVVVIVVLAFVWNRRGAQTPARAGAAQITVQWECSATPKEQPAEPWTSSIVE